MSEPDDCRTNSPDWKAVHLRLRKLFLDREESNTGDLSEDINHILRSIPRIMSDDPFLGCRDYAYDFLERFEELPQQPLDKLSVLTAIAGIFHGIPKWHHPHVMHNINPPPMIGAVAAAAVANLYNPNAIWDFVSGGAHEMEQQIIRQISRAAGWLAGADGVFTFGGKGCLTYAMRIGLNRCVSSVSSQGIRGSQPVVITSEANHYSIDTVCSLVGIGSRNCLRVGVSADETMDLDLFEELLDRVLKEGRPVATIVVSGGNTLHLSIDDLTSVNRIIHQMVNKYHLSYRPYTYFDTAVGWPWIFFIDYPFLENPLGLPREILPILESATSKIRAISLADGFGIDFHKSGMCPYLTSLFVTKDGRELHSIHKDEITEFERKPFGGNFLQHHTIEHSRSVAPIASAWVSMQMVGVDGYRTYLAHGVSIASTIRNILPEYKFELLNPHSLGFASVFSPVPMGDSYSYEELLTADLPKICAHNLYTFQLFNYLQDGPRNGLGSFVFRFLPQYRKSVNGHNVAVIVVYPMALDIDVEAATEIGRNVGQIKKQMDAQHDIYEDVSSLIPVHVPK